ncbi:uncharacterized protein LOC124914119 [Impatiens glandulifera]|uniref:uncharacterized protein LOC124914119 n=1 Tax=Impatiens glandulifera TaxID=253017 RepID=UPI001FB09013|nr:uncharacterized protein LOC124914119 [Impatiens glandulifera]
MSRPPSIHDGFFSSVRQVEKRLKLENPPEPCNFPSPQPPSSLPKPTENDTQVDSLSSPIYLNFDIPNNSSVLQDSETPREFLSDSDSFDFPSKTGISSQLNSNHNNNNNVKDSQSIESDEEDGLDEIESLIRLLGLSDLKKTVGFVSDDGDSQFYGKIVGVKGPKSGKEVQRLEGWIKHFLNEDGDKCIEPLRLAHLLLGKAALVSGNTDDDDGFKGIPFPSTIEDFLRNDPPKD